MLLVSISIPLMLLGVAVAVGPLRYAVHRSDAWDRDAEVAGLGAARVAATAPRPTRVRAERSEAFAPRRPGGTRPAPRLVGAGARP